MDLNSEHLHILSIALDYYRLKRYLGIFPKKTSLYLNKKCIDELLKSKYLEKIKIKMDDDIKIKGYRITPLGFSLLSKNDEELKEGVSLLWHYIDVLNDIFHISHLSGNNGVAPQKLLSNYDEKDIKHLCEQGYIFRIKVRWTESRKLKGYLVAARGELELRNAARI